MKNKKKKAKKPVPSSFERASKYGTYNIQGTCGTENNYPAIGQK